MTIRRATAADAGAIAEIWNHYIRTSLVTFNSQEKTVDEVAGLIATRDAEGRAFLVADGSATESGQIAGFATYFQFRGGIGYAHAAEHTIQLAPGAGGAGLGRALMHATEDHARASGHHTLFAGVSSGNPDGIAFHARMGFEEVAILREVGWKWDKWWDLHLMQKFL